VKKKKAPKIENKRDTYFLSVTRGKSNRPYAIKIVLCSRGKVNQRIANLQTGSVDRLHLMAVVQGSYERKFKRKYAGYRLGQKGEFFKPAPDLLGTIKMLAELGKLIEQIEHKDVFGFVKNLEKQQQLVVG